MTMGIFPLATAMLYYMRRIHVNRCVPESRYSALAKPKRPVTTLPTSFHMNTERQPCSPKEIQKIFCGSPDAALWPYINKGAFQGAFTSVHSTLWVVAQLHSR